MSQDRFVPQRPHPQRGVTLIELLVAMAVGLVVTIVALSMLVLGRTGYSAVDSTTQLIDKERFAVDAISRVVQQAGYQDYAAPIMLTRGVSVKSGVDPDPEPDVFAWNNAIYATPDNLLISVTTKIADENRPGLCSVSDTSCRNGSDVLMIRFQGVSTITSSSTADTSMINCRGNGETGFVTGVLSERAANFFYVQRNAATGEPSLHCASYNHATGVYSNDPLIEGVESMQLLFGTDNVVPLTAPTVGGLDSIADRWLRADQLKVAANPVATKENWRRVRAIRIGLVLRGPVGSAQERIAASFAPLGSPTFVAAADTGSQLNVAADGRLRRVLTFTVHIRNDLTLR